MQGIFSLCVQYSVSVEPEWTPHTENQLADFISHIQDFDDWKLHPGVFSWLNNKWGPCTVNRFASFYNTQLPRFNSRFCNPGSEAVHCFTCGWAGEMNWWCPPVYLIPRLNRHAHNCKCRGILILSHWSSAPFWPLICPNGCHLACLSRIGVTCLSLTPYFYLVGVPQGSFVQSQPAIF